MDSGQYIVLYQCKFIKLITVLWLYKRISLFLGRTHIKVFMDNVSWCILLTLSGSEKLCICGKREHTKIGK